MAELRKVADIEIRIQDEKFAATYVGTDSEIAQYADDYFNTTILFYCDNHGITDPNEVDEILADSWMTVEKDSEPLMMYAIHSDLDGVIGVYFNEEEARNAVEVMGHQYVEDLIATEDPMDVFGTEEFDSVQKMYLFNDFMKTVDIQVTPVYGVQEVIE